MRTLINVLIAALAIGVGHAANDSQLTKLTRISESLLGKQLLSSQWKQLRPYLLDKHALDSPQAVCSFSCNGSIELRSGYRLDYVYVNPQHLGPWKPAEAIIWSVTLARGKQKLFHREIEPK